MPRIELKLVPPSKLQYAIRIAFEDDDMLKEYHIAPNNHAAVMAKHTFNRIIHESLEGKARHYKVVISGLSTREKIIGYTTVFYEPAMMLYSFGINAKYRKPWILKRWMKLIDEQLFKGLNYGAGLYEKNRRAIRFLETNGFTKINYNVHDKSYFLCRYSEQ